MTATFQKPHLGSPRRRWQIWLARAAGLLCSVIVSLLLVEVALRVAGLDVPLVWEPDPVLGWHHIPGARRRFTEEGDGLITINRLGMRDQERPIAKPPGTLRIGIFGDSMTEAVQVNLDKTFCHLLEQNLNRDSDYPVEVLNFGVNGYTTVQELLLLQHKGLQYDLDIAVLAVFLDNDVAGCDPETNTGPGEVPFRGESSTDAFDFSRCQRSFDHYHQNPIYALRRNSAIYRWASHWRRRHAAATTRVASADVPKRFMLYHPSPGAEWTQAWSAFEDTLLDFVVESRRNGVQPVLVSLPCSHLVNRESWLNYCRSLFPSADAESWDLDAPERRLAALADRHGIPLCQPLSSLREAPPKPPMFFGEVGHLTPRGHELVEACLHRFLQPFIREGKPVRDYAVGASSTSAANEAP